MAHSFAHIVPPILRLFAVLALGACRTANASSHGDAAAKPIQVAAAIAGCENLDDCSHQCSKETPNSCVSAGRLYEFGHGVPADPARAFQLYEQACAFKYAGGCYNAAVLLEAGKGVPTDRRQARELYAQVCQMGSKTSCERARTLSENAAE